MELKENGEKAVEEKSERGAGMIEYAILAAIVVGIAILARTSLSAAASKAYSAVDNQVNTSVN